MRIGSRPNGMSWSFSWPPIFTINQVQTGSLISSRHWKKFAQWDPSTTNKTVIEVFADFLVYLLKCASSFICKTYANGERLWRSIKDQLYFILSPKWMGRCTTGVVISSCHFGKPYPSYLCWPCSSFIHDRRRSHSLFCCTEWSSSWHNARWRRSGDCWCWRGHDQH